MKTATKTRIVENAKSQIAGADYHALRLTGDGKLIAPHPCHGWSMAFCLPHELLTPELSTILEEQGRVREAAHQRWLADYYAKREAEEAELHKLGSIFMLLAGEETEVVAHGTFAECLGNLCLVCRCPRDHYSGKGAWLIVRTDTHAEVRSGYFDRDTYWES